MPTIDFATFCCSKDIERLGAYRELHNRVSSHGYEFNNVYVVRQRCGNNFNHITFSSPDFAITELRSEYYPNILADFDLPDVDKKADEMTHGPTAPHYWKWHVINHLIVLKESKADYIVFSDADCRILHQKSSWVNIALEALRAFPDVLMIAPSDGGSMAEGIIKGFHGGLRLTQNVSQQLFIANRNRLLGVDFNVPWDWDNLIFHKNLSPGEPFQEYYALLEGRLWRYMDKYKLYRGILSEDWRYWHDQW